MFLPPIDKSKNGLYESPGVQEWFRKGRLHRPEEEGPASIRTFYFSITDYEKGIFTKTEKPSSIIEYIFNGEMHRKNGPAYIVIDCGKVCALHWWHKGTKIKSWTSIGDYGRETVEETIEVFQKYLDSLSKEVK